MKELDEKTEEKIQELIFRAQEEFNAYQTEKCVDTLKEGITLIPGNPAEFQLGFTLVNEICEKSYDDGLLDIVNEWLEQYKECDKAQRGFGDSEYLVGRLAFDNGDFESAKSNFKIADEKSGGRIWRRKDAVKYFKFYKEK